ncbi:transglutaminase-like domain-containing protein [Desulfobacula sp.]|uniref:transglutaminase-like domain-containing protein n=1 Tax=Desulfobacula sp. TaxID=2593537 RepID=UPI00262EB07E|nr:transglutaminase-like domain-containing protein [Desulfobacula sp.]
MKTLWFALIVAVILESARLVKVKFELTPSDVNKFVDISIILLAGTIVMALTIENQKALSILLKWLPLIFFPIMAVQQFSTTGKIDLRSFFLGGRKKVEDLFYEPKTIDVSYIYSLFCLFSAGTAKPEGLVFYSAVSLFFTWALWQVRSKRFSCWVWAGCILGILISGYGVQKSLRMAAWTINRWMIQYYADYYTTNPFKTHTALGEIGKFKLSDKIMLRAWSDAVMPGETFLLHTATYNKFILSNWFIRSRFESIVPSEDFPSLWQIHPPVNETKKMTIYFRQGQKTIVLSLPFGVISISEMKVGQCEKNELQVIRIAGGPSLIKGVVSYTGQLTYDAPPDDHDFLIPKKEKNALAAIAAELSLENKSDEEILTCIKQYFLTHYTYSLDLKGKGEAQTPLLNFLRHTKAGHCEFFATATALLLRQVNIPARYATGYMAHEYSRLENQLVVRKRDAHAWVKVYVDGQWKNFDTTPPSFIKIDSQNIAVSRVTDLFSFLGFKLSQLRHETGEKLMNQYGVWLIVPLAGILFFRLRKTNRIKRARMPGTPGENKKQRPGDLSFFPVETLLSQKGFPRYPHETYSAWFGRIDPYFGSRDIMDHLQPVLLLLNRHRFSKHGLNKQEKKKFESCLNRLLKTVIQDLPLAQVDGDIKSVI